MQDEKQNELRCTIERRPQGWPSVGDFVDESGCLYRVIERGEAIFAELNGGEDFIHGVVVQADWDDVPNGADVWTARLHVDMTGKYLGDVPMGINWESRANQLARDLEQERIWYRASQSLLGNKDQAINELVLAMRLVLGDCESAVRQLRETLAKFDRGTL